LSIQAAAVIRKKTDKGAGPGAWDDPDEKIGIDVAFDNSLNYEAHTFINRMEI